MTISILLAQQIAQLFLMIFMGFLIVKAGLLKDEDSKVLSKIVLYLIIPCVILNAFQVDYTPETVRGLLVAFAASLLMQVVLLFAVSALGRVFHLDAVEITSVYYSNSGNLIVPRVTAVLGAEWVLYSCIYTSVQLVFFWTHCKNAAHHQHSICVRRILCNHKQTVQQVAKQQQYKKRAKYSKLLADDREDHIVLCFRNCCNLLRTVAKSFSEKSNLPLPSSKYN